MLLSTNGKYVFKCSQLNLNKNNAVVRILLRSVEDNKIMIMYQTFLFSLAKITLILNSSRILDNSLGSIH